MNSITIGFLGSMMAALFFGLYPVPRKYVKLGINDYIVSMSMGIIFTGIIINISQGNPLPDLDLSHWFFGLLAGFFWCTGTIFYVYSVDCIGVGRATPIKNLTAILGSVFGLVFFKEYLYFSFQDFFFLFLGTILMVYSGKILGSIRGRANITRASCPINLVIPRFLKKHRNALTAGWILALGAALLYALFSVPIRILSTETADVFSFITPVGLGALLTSLISDLLFTSKHNWKEIDFKGHLLAGSSGLLWTIAFIGLSTGIKHLGLAVSNPLANSSTIVSVLYAALIGGEIDFKLYRKETIAGLIIGTIGIIFLGLSL